MSRWRAVMLPILSGLYWAACTAPGGERVNAMPGWERDLRAALCGMCVASSILLLTSIGRNLFKDEEWSDE